MQDQSLHTTFPPGDAFWLDTALGIGTFAELLTLLPLVTHSIAIRNVVPTRRASSNVARHRDTNRSTSATLTMLDRSASSKLAVTDEWVAEMYPAIHRAAWAITGNPSAADDLAQETFVIAIEKWDRFDGRSKRSTWLHGILIRLSRKYFRTRLRLHRRLQTWGRRKNVATETSDPASKFAEMEWQQSIWAEIAKLPRPQAEAITLRFHSELTYEQIAETLNCAVGTAKTRVHQGLKRLRQSNTLHDSLEDTFTASTDASNQPSSEALQ